MYRFILVLTFMIISPVFAQVNEDVLGPDLSVEDVDIRRENQFSLRLNIRLGEECHYIIFESKNAKRFGVMQVSTDVITDLDFFKNIDSKYIRKNASFYKYKKILKGKTKDHIFYSKDNDLYLKYKFKDGRFWIIKETTILKGLACALQ